MSSPSTAAIPSAYDWEVSPEDSGKPVSLIVQLRRQVYVFPWFRLLFAEGDNDIAELYFTSHIVRVDGHGLLELLEAAATQRIVRIVQPTENEAKFGVRGNGAELYHGPGIVTINVEAIDQ